MVQGSQLLQKYALDFSECAKIITVIVDLGELFQGIVRGCPGLSGWLIIGSLPDVPAKRVSATRIC